MKLLLLVGMIKMSIGRHGKNVINNVTLKKKKAVTINMEGKVCDFN